MKANPKNRPSTSQNVIKSNVGKNSKITFKSSPKTNTTSLKNVGRLQETTWKNEINKFHGTLDWESTLVPKKLQSSPLINLKTNNSNNSNNLGRINTSNSIKPFQKVDHDFYVANTERGLWEKELQKNKTEKKIFSEKKIIQENFSNFGGINVSSILSENKNLSSDNKEKNNQIKNLKNSFLEKSKKVNTSRFRDFHGESKVLATSQYYSTNTDTNLNVSKFNTNDSQILRVPNKKFDSVKIVSVNLDDDLFSKPVKKITPMHLKFFESTMQNDLYIEKVAIPRSHNSFDKKDDCYQTSYSPSFKKKLELLKHNTKNFFI